jgi:hypothetical protein
MTTLNHDVPNLLDISTRYTSDGKPLPVAEILTKRKPAFEDIPFQEANTTNGHRIAVETELPEAVIRKLNMGVKPSTGRANDITESSSEFASLGLVDKSLADLSSNVSDFRVKKNARHIEAIGQKFEDQLFNGDKVTVGGVVGLKARYDTLSGTLARQVISCNGTGNDLTSMFVVGWGMNSVYGIFAKGTKAGIQHSDYGDELVDDGNGGKYPAYRDWFALQAGLAVEDPRTIVRVCNIDVDNLKDAPTPGTDLILVNELIRATHRLEGMGGIRPVIYCNRDIFEWLDIQANNRTILALKQSEVDGKAVTSFRGIPIRQSDFLLWNETAVA